MQITNRRSGQHRKGTPCASGTLSEFICRSRWLLSLLVIPKFHAYTLCQRGMQITNRRSGQHRKGTSCTTGPLSEFSSAATDSSHLISAWHANCDWQRGLMWQGDVWRTRPPLRVCSRQHLILSYVVTNLYAYS